MPAVVEYTTLAQLFHRLIEHNRGQNKAALGYKEKRSKEWIDISWEELDQRVKAFAGYLHSHGIRKGDRVAILSENRPEWAVTDMATQWLGGVNVSLYTSLPASEVEYILKDSGTKVFIVSTSIQLRKAEQVFDNCPDLERVVTMSELRGEHPDYVTHWDETTEPGLAYWNEHSEDLEALRDSVEPGDLSALIYTSGTTGVPKGVMLTHENFCSNAKSALPMVPFGPTDHHLSFLPLSHSFERTAGYVAALSAGAKVTYAESVDAVSKNLPEVQPTIMISVPRLFERVYNIIAKSVEEGSDAKKKIFNWAVGVGTRYATAKRPGPILTLQQRVAHKLVFEKLHAKLGGRVRFAISGGAALPKAIGEFFQAAGVKILEGYGLTETAPVLAVSPYESPRYGTVGHVIPGVTVGIQRLSDLEVITQISGEDYPNTTTTEEGEILAKGPNIMRGYWNNPDATREAIDDAGWYHTGDVGRFVDGYLQITDRIKHMIVSRGGKNIYPGPIEEQFKTMPMIDQLMIVGEGQAYLTALVVPNEEVLIAFGKEHNLGVKPSELHTHETVKKHYKDAFRAHAKSAASHEKVRDFRIIPEPFSVDNGMMTPTLKLRRKIIEQQYADLIDEMYANVV
ncbi:MAG: long-chain fatty acid--CoA ligase [Bacteroidota bacterium]